MNKPRKPTQEELDCLRFLVVEEAACHPFDDDTNTRAADEAVKRVSYVAVFDDFEWQHPRFPKVGYKKLMVVAWSDPKDGFPYCPDLFAWDANNRKILNHLTPEWGWDQIPL